MARDICHTQYLVESYMDAKLGLFVDLTVNEIRIIHILPRNLWFLLRLNTSFQLLLPFLQRQDIPHGALLLSDSAHLPLGAPCLVYISYSPGQPHEHL